MKPMRLVDSEGREREIRLDRNSASMDGRAVSLEIPSPTASELVVDGRRFRVHAARDGDRKRIWVWCEGSVYEFTSEAGTSRKGRSSAADHHGGGLEAPMPGRVRRLVASPGARVARGDVLLVLEAMKMEHAIRAPHDGVLQRFHVAEGDLVEAGIELAELSSEGTAGGA
jgi:3-methylcrotonyl-CoA carboxylase alpha subunit